MSAVLLPHALLDLTVARIAARLDGAACHKICRSVLCSPRRHAHQSVSLDTLTTPEFSQHVHEGDRSLYARRQARPSALASAGLFPHSQDRPMTELERRIAELKEAPVAETSQNPSIPSYSEAELISMYEDLLAIPAASQQQDHAVQVPDTQQEQDHAIVRGVLEALYAHEDPAAIPSDAQSQYTAAIAKLREIIDVLEPTRAEPEAPSVDLSVLSTEEWISLVRISAKEQDGQAAETVIELMQRSGSAIPEAALETTASLYADVGDVVNTERFLASFAGPSPSERLRDLHIKAHIRAIEPRTFPTQALSVLHDYEARGLPAPQRSYTRAITALLSVRSSVAEAQAWDLFSHMRYVAHPVPDPYLYTLMITACGSRVIAPQPARALDLFTEMTVDKGIAPTAASYTAAIFACAMSGDKLYVGEAFRLAKEMLDGHRDAYGNHALIPDRRTFCALLEGAKRTGDLAKVRWILAEIVSESQRAARGDVQDPVVVDERIMTHVFHAYAAYKPPFNRGAAVLVEQNHAASSESSSTVQSTAATASQDVPHDGSPSTSSATEAAPQVPVTIASHFTSLLPQSHGEVVGEARALLARIINDAAPDLRGSSLHSPELADGSMPHAFQKVTLTARLLNAFLSVHYTHALFDESAQLYRTIFAELGVEKNARTYVEALERAAYARRGERKQALKFAREVWEEWCGVEEKWGRREENAMKLEARLIERAYVGMIRVLSLTGNTREAVQLVRRFVERYPPDTVKRANPKLALRSTRTVLQAPRPVVRLMSPTEIPDDTVPPLLSFPEVEVLHHKLVAKGDKESIGYLKYVCMSYSGALMRRKEATLHAKPVGDEGAASQP
ncbi:hypothetical protein OH76DRAFT_1446274 [Lentinus brumalis]|uniref:Pentacotripeptide-repeat region of PRORP domain-containing protein n=1 Tax=Lentinus brumalis TaxID=2498619 RepID=A0A371CUV9_9APHY|nr:hypothetical protein OH76DRAFT_1446274 [Polyporus brumalis]